MPFRNRLMYIHTHTHTNQLDFNLTTQKTEVFIQAKTYMKLENMIKQLDTRYHRLYYPIYVKYPKELNIWRQKTDYYFLEIKIEKNEK